MGGKRRVDEGERQRRKRREELGGGRKKLDMAPAGLASS